MSFIKFLFLPTLVCIVAIHCGQKTKSHSDEIKSLVQKSQTSILPVSADCDPSLWDHVYNPDRLEVIQECITVKGIVQEVRSEKDGDKHILLNLNADQQYLLNEVNISEMNGCLILEPICVGSVTQDNAVIPCSGYSNSITIPKPGDVVTVTGSYVLDTKHGGMEIHPVSSITVTGSYKLDYDALDQNPIVGYTPTGLAIHKGPRGGLYHWSKNGNKVYEN